MNNHLKKTYYNIQNIYAFTDFVNPNMDNFCYCEGVSKKNCKVHSFVHIMNHLLGETNDEGKINWEL